MLYPLAAISPCGDTKLCHSPKHQIRTPNRLDIKGDKSYHGDGALHKQDQINLLRSIVSDNKCSPA